MKTGMNGDILRLSLPNIISNITVPLLGLVDMALMGHLGSELYIGAIALGGVIVNFIYWGFGFLRMSTSGFAAQAYGENNITAVMTVLVRSMAVALFTGIIIVALQFPIARAGFGLIGGSEEVKALAAEYFLIRIWAAPAALSLMVFSGWFLGMQNARYPMLIAIATNLLNILMSLLFVYGMDMKSDGVALGTTLSQYMGLLLALYLYHRSYPKPLAHLNPGKVFQLKPLANFFRVNADIFIRSFCIISVFTFFTSESASTNDTILAVNSLLLQLLMFFSFFIDGFAYAGEALVGRFLGARQTKQLTRAVRLLFKWGTGMAILFSMVYFLGIRTILKLLTSQEELLRNAEPYLWWVILIPMASFSSFIWDGIFIGATASAAMRNTLLVATFLIFAPVYLILGPLWGNHALWMAMVMFMLTRGIVQTFLFKKYILAKLPAE